MERRRRVLIVGAGFRVKNNFLPTLHCLKREFEIVGVHARTLERLRPVADLWNVPALSSLDDVDFDAVDLVVISVPPSQNAVVLRRRRRAPRGLVCSSTPPFSPPGSNSLPHFRF
jgi:predicted dehydrogenase